MSVLKDWINPYYLQPEVIAQLRQDCLARPFLNYLVLDDFFLEEKFRVMTDNSESTDFVWDVPSESYRRKLKPENLTDAFLLGKEWAEYLKLLSGAPENVKGSCVVANDMKQSPGTNGYWIHSDKHSPKFKIQFIALFYLNESRIKDDGGILQLWRRVSENTSKETHRVEMKDFMTATFRKRLDFLNVHKKITVSENDNPKTLILMDEIIPRENRLVVMNLANDPGFHSVTPIEKKRRRVISQFFI